MHQHHLTDTSVVYQIMLVEGYQGQKVQDVKKPIQKMMVDRVKNLYFS